LLAIIPAIIWCYDNPKRLLDLKLVPSIIQFIHQSRFLDLGEHTMRVRSNISSILLCCLLLLGTSLAFAATNKPAKNPQVQQAQTLVTQLSKGNFAGAERDFNDKMKQGLPPAKLKAVWAQITAQAGPFRNTGETKTLSYLGNPVVLIKTTFKNGELWTQVAFDKAGKIAGLYFKPAS
jgi:Protein of unknown function (DUF3887)